MYTHIRPKDTRKVLWVNWQKVLMIGRAYTWKTSGLVAVTAEVGRLFHEGIVRGKKEYL